MPLQGKIAGAARTVGTVALAVALIAAAIGASGYPVASAFQALFTGATGLGPPSTLSSTDLTFHFGPWSIGLSEFLLAQTLGTLGPTLLAGVAVALGIRCGLFNIGVQGQMIMGALLAAVVGTALHAAPHGIAVLTLFIVGGLGGAAWAALPGLLRAYRGVHEVLVTIMLNFVAGDMAEYIAAQELPDHSTMAVQTPAIASSARLAALVPQTTLTAAVVLALVVAAVYMLLLNRTRFGFQVRAVGMGPDAARLAGIPVPATRATVMALSGAVAGLAGAGQVAGVYYHYLPGVAGTYGFDGIAVACLAGSSGVGLIPSALFFSALSSGGAYMQLQSGVPASLTVIVQAVVIVAAAVRLAGRRDAK